jgi:hypothetical protein
METYSTPADRKVCSDSATEKCLRKQYFSVKHESAQYFWTFLSALAFLIFPENLGKVVFVSCYIYNCPTVLNPSSRIYNYATLELVLFNTGVYCSLR